MRIGIYGGTFDPIHLGHIALALEVLEWHHLDTVWFCPANINPFRIENSPAPAEHRLAMLQEALSPISGFKVLENELKRPPPSYTIDTLLQLDQQLEQPHQLFLILGADSAATFSRWHRAEEIVALAKPLVGTRKGEHPLDGEDPRSNVTQALQRGMTPTRRVDVSSSEIRERRRQGKRIEHLVPLKVFEYIRDHQLYT